MAQCFARENAHDLTCKYCGSFIELADYTVCRSCGKPNLNYDVQRKTKIEAE